MSEHTEISWFHKLISKAPRDRGSNYCFGKYSFSKEWSPCGDSLICLGLDKSREKKKKAMKHALTFITLPI